jgi:hypothetical protein
MLYTYVQKQLSQYEGRHISNLISILSPQEVKVPMFGDSLTSVSLHAHIYKNTVKR